MQTDKNFSFTHFVIPGKRPVDIEEVNVSATAFFENGILYDVSVSDIKYKGISVKNLLKIVSPDFVIECSDAGLLYAQNNLCRSAKAEAEAVRQEN